jgi:DNA-directed RNA polymerase subunit RPC12/RpoP
MIKTINEKTEETKEPKVAPVAPKQLNINHGKLANLPHALRDRLTRQFYCHQSAVPAHKGSIMTLDPNKARLFNHTYLTTTYCFDWEKVFEAVPKTELIKLQKSYSPQESATENVKASKNSLMNDGYNCLKCGHENKYTPFVFTHWKDTIESKCNDCGVKHLIKEGQVELKGKK